MIERVLHEDGYEHELSEGVADELVTRDVIYMCGEHGDDEANERQGACTQGDHIVYHVRSEYEFLTSDDLDALCDGVLVADEVLAGARKGSALTYTVTLALPINRDGDEPLTAVEAVQCFQDEAEQRSWIYHVAMPDGSEVRVDMPSGTILPITTEGETT